MPLLDDSPDLQPYYFGPKKRPQPTDEKIILEDEVDITRQNEEQAHKERSISLHRMQIIDRILILLGKLTE